MAQDDKPRRWVDASLDQYAADRKREAKGIRGKKAGFRFGRRRVQGAGS